MKNYDFYIYSVNGVSFHFSDDGKLLIFGADENEIDANELMRAWTGFHQTWDEFHKRKA